MRVTVKINYNRTSTLTTLRSASDEALTTTGNQALKDTDQYVPEDQGGLINSGHENSDMHAVDGVFKMRWSTPYARYLFRGEVMYGDPTNRTYGPEKLNFTKALARMEWSIYAGDVYKDDWRAVYEASLKKELRK